MICASVRSTSDEDRIGGEGACVLQLRLGENPVAHVVLNGTTIVNLAAPVTFDNAQLFVSAKKSAVGEQAESAGTIVAYSGHSGSGERRKLIQRPTPSRFERDEPL